MLNSIIISAVQRQYYTELRLYSIYSVLFQTILNTTRLSELRPTAYGVVASGTLLASGMCDSWHANALGQAATLQQLATTYGVRQPGPGKRFELRPSSPFVFDIRASIDNQSILSQVYLEQQRTNRRAGSRGQGASARIATLQQYFTVCSDSHFPHFRNTNDQFV